MKDAAQEAANILGDAVQQMRAARDKPRDDPEAVMEAALREIDQRHYYIIGRLIGSLHSAALTAHMHNRSFCDGYFEECPNCQSWRNMIAEAEAIRGEGIAREAIRKVEAWRARKE